MLGWAKRRAWSLRLLRQGPIQSHLRLLRRTQFLPEAELLKLQQETAGALLRHAYDATRYYHRVLGAAGVVDGSGGVHPERLSAVPLLDKATIREHFEGMKSADLARRRWRVRTTGGSSGEPGRFVQDAEYKAWGTALGRLWDEWTGYREGDRRIHLWGTARDVDSSREPLRAQVGSWLRNERRLPAFPVTEEVLLSYARIINEERAAQVVAYVESLYELALSIERAGLRMDYPPSLVASAGALYPTMRSTIEHAFGVRVFDRYGSTEVNGIASECDRHEGLHVAHLCQLVEILRPDGSPADLGEEGEIVVTNLTNYAMPLVRYRIGDRGAWATEPCSCGRPGPLLARVSGRVHDTFITADGGQVDGKYFLWLLDYVPWVRRFRVVQEAVDAVDIYFQPWRDPDETDLGQMDEIRTLVQKAMGAECVVTFKIVPEIEVTASGKHLNIISKVRSLEDVRR